MYKIPTLLRENATIQHPLTRLLIGHGEKSQILRDFQGQIRGKISQFCGIFIAIFGVNFAEKQSLKYV